MRMVWDNDRGTFDIGRTPLGGIDAGDQLGGAVVVSLFTDLTADPADMTPDLGTDRRGWWADAARDVTDRMGSLLWLELRQKKTDAVRRRIEEKAQDALAWLIEDGLASDVTVSATFPAQLVDAVVLSVIVTQPNGIKRDWKVDLVWGAAAQ